MATGVTFSTAEWDDYYDETWDDFEVTWDGYENQRFASIGFSIGVESSISMYIEPEEAVSFSIDIQSEVLLMR